MLKNILSKWYPDKLEQYTLLSAPVRDQSHAELDPDPGLSKDHRLLDQTFEKEYERLDRSVSQFESHALSERRMFTWQLMSW